MDAGLLVAVEVEEDEDVYAIQRGGGWGEAAA
jgi:hypothetical protein